MSYKEGIIPDPCLVFSDGIGNATFPIRSGEGSGVLGFVFVLKLLKFCIMSPSRGRN